MSFEKNLELILDLNVKAFKQGIKSASTAVSGLGPAVSQSVSKGNKALKQTKEHYRTNTKAARVYNNEVRKTGGYLDSLKGKVVALAGAYLGLQTLIGIKEIIKGADAAAFSLEYSLKAANREFSNVGNANSWGEAIDRLSGKLRIYSKSELKNAAAATIDMTKRLGLSSDQMEEVILRTGDLAAGKTDLRGGVERVTAALRGEAEASEYLSLTLNETYVKAWHEAHNAQNQAWKDLTDLEKAQVRYNVFLEQAVPLNGKAAASVNTLGGAYALVKTQISDAVSENQEAVEVTKELAKFISENADEIGDLAVMLTKAVAGTLKFVISHKEAIAVLGGGALVIGALATGISALNTIWRAMNVVMLATTGLKLVPWLGNIVTALKGLKIAVLGLKGTIGALSGLFLAWEAGWQIGTLLSKFDVVKRAGTAMAAVITKGMLRAKKAWAWATGGDTDAVQREIDEAERIYSEMFSSIGQGAKTAGTAHESIAKSAKESAETQADVQKVATEEMKKAYKSYADTVKKLQDDIAGREQSLAEQLREMDRSGMSDLKAWKDRKNEAEEFAETARKAEEAAKAAFEAGDVETGKAKYKEAVTYFDKAKDAAAELNTEIRAGDKVIQSQQQSLKKAKPLVEEYGQAGIDIQNEFSEAIQKTARALNEQSGGKLAAELPEIAKAFGDLDIQAASLVEKSAWFNDKWNEAWDEFLEEGGHAIWELDTKLSQLTKDRHINVYVTEVAKKALGGLIGTYQRLASGGSVDFRNMLSGGFMPGFGGGDRRAILGEDGEYMLNKFSVREAGLAAAAYFNNRNWPALVRELVDRFGISARPVIRRATGGAINAIQVLPSFQPLQAGGEVSSTAFGDTYNLNMTFSGNVSQLSRQHARDTSRMVLAEFQKIHRGAS